MARCRCQSGRIYKRCCLPAHEGRPATTPEALMRSRYCAYALGLVDYIIATTDPAGPQWRSDRVSWQAEIETFCRITRFEGLEILAAEGDEVTFRAHLTRGGQDTGFSERSRFVEREGRWLYHSGQPIE